MSLCPVGAPVTKSNRQTSQNRPDLGVWHTGHDGCGGSPPAGALLVGSPPAGPARLAGGPPRLGASAVGAPVTKSNRQTSQNRPDLGVWHTGQDGCCGSAPAGTLLAGPAPVGAAAAGSPIRRPHASQ